MNNIIVMSVSRDQNLHQWPFSIWSCGSVGHIMHIYEFLYNFDTVLHPFLRTGTSDKTNFDKSNQLLKCCRLLSSFLLSI